MHAKELPMDSPKNLNALCMRCFLESVMVKQNINLRDSADRERIADGWGEAHIGWLTRHLNGEIDWIPEPHANALVVLLNLTSSQESILAKLNRRNFFSSPYRHTSEPCPICGN